MNSRCEYYGNLLAELKRIIEVRELQIEKKDKIIEKLKDEIYNLKIANKEMEKAIELAIHEIPGATLKSLKIFKTLAKEIESKDAIIKELKQEVKDVETALHETERLFHCPLFESI